MIKIDKNVPLPSPPAPRHQRYPFSEMGVGDSFSIPDTNLQRLHSAAYSWSKRHGGRFQIRREENAVRIWRIE